MTEHQTQRLDGTALAKSIREKLSREIEELAKATGKTPGLAVLLLGEDPASQIYVKNKGLACQKIGMQSFIHRLPSTASEQEVLHLIDTLNTNENAHGILVQLPLSPGLDGKRIIRAIDPQKDVDGLHPFNIGCLAEGTPTFVPCTPLGIIALLTHYGIELDGKKAVVVGRSNLVGKPVSQLLLAHNATVTICHSHTRDLDSICASADVLVAAAGKPQLLGAAAVKPGAVVVDVGIHRLADGSIVGDTDQEAIENVCSWLTPVPGGIGPMTVAMLLANTVLSFKRRYGIESN